MITYMLEIFTIQGKKNLIYFLLGLSFLSVFINLPKTVNLDILNSNFKNSHYSSTKDKISKIYENVESNSIVVFSQIDLRYLRLDLQFENPYSLPYNNKKEEWGDFLIRIDPEKNKKIFMMVPKELDKERYSESVINATHKHDSNNLVQIN